MQIQLESVRAFVKLLLVGDLHSRRNLSVWQKVLQLELDQVVDPVTILDIQTWIIETKAPVVRLSAIEGDFDQLAREIRKGGGVSRSIASCSLPSCTFTVCHCEVGELWQDHGPSSPRTDWQFSALRGLPGRRHPKSTDPPTPARNPQIEEEGTVRRTTPRGQHCSRC